LQMPLPETLIEGGVNSVGIKRGQPIERPIVNKRKVIVLGKTPDGAGISISSTLAGAPSKRYQAMTTFDDRERAFEKKFVIDEELKFKIEARRDQAVGEWAAAQLGLSGAAAKEYVRAVRNEGVVHKGEGVFQKVRKDFLTAGVAVSDGQLREIMAQYMTLSTRDVQRAEGITSP